MNFELRLLLAITRNLPKVRGAGWFANKLKAIYNRKPRPKEIITFQGLTMELEPNECVDGAMLFYPHLYDWRELFYMKNRLKTGCFFVDAGANIGWYSLHAARIVGCVGGVMAIEMEDYNTKKLMRNIALNNMDNVHVLQVGLSDRCEELKIRMNTSGNRGGNSLISADEKGVTVACHPLSSLLMENGWDRIDGLKIDIEGMEYRVLNEFFENVSRQLYPGFIIIELNMEYQANGSTELHDLLLKYGYKEDVKAGLNSIYSMDIYNE